MENKEIQGKDIALISYLTVIGLVIAFVMNNDKKFEFAKFHIRQSLGLFLTAIALSFIAIIPILGWLVWIVGIFILLYMWIKGLMNAINGKEEVMPILGEKYAEIFKNL
ncbi:membrane protein [Flavobacterium sp. 316]|uniref:DUF4870 domain-containing protein n=1 Tax=Flavobacterium sp. 316 TaxID=1603293 RepID=UPI0005E54A9A|nr:membrane protein [Flavobacterium sp. 316]KIX21556.1 membrane protein [Flavobacterium sp. 316]